MLEKISKDFVIDHRTRHVEGLPPFSHSHQFNEIYFCSQVNAMFI